MLSPQLQTFVPLSRIWDQNSEPVKLPQSFVHVRMYCAANTAWVCSSTDLPALSVQPPTSAPVGAPDSVPQIRFAPSPWLAMIQRSVSVCWKAFHGAWTNGLHGNEYG